MNYIKAWQSLPEYGISLFVVRFTGKSKDELLGIANNRLMRMELNSGDHLKTWRYNTMKVGGSDLYNVNLSRACPRAFYYRLYSIYTGMERKLGSEAHDGPIRGGERQYCL